MDFFNQLFTFCCVLFSTFLFFPLSIYLFISIIFIISVIIHINIKNLVIYLFQSWQAGKREDRKGGKRQEEEDRAQVEKHSGSQTPALVSFCSTFEYTTCVQPIHPIFFLFIQFSASRSFGLKVDSSTGYFKD